MGAPKVNFYFKSHAEFWSIWSGAKNNPRGVEKRLLLYNKESWKWYAKFWNPSRRSYIDAGRPQLLSCSPLKIWRKSPNCRLLQNMAPNKLSPILKQILSQLITVTANMLNMRSVRLETRVSKYLVNIMMEDFSDLIF